MPEVIASLWPPEPHGTHECGTDTAEATPLECEMSVEEILSPSAGPGTTADQDPVVEAQKADTARDTTNDTALTTAREDTAPLPTSSPAQSSELTMAQNGGDDTVPDHDEPTPPPGQAMSPHTAPLQQQTSPLDQNQSPSSHLTERQKQARRRTKKLAITMNILLGESGNGKKSDSQSSP